MPKTGCVKHFVYLQCCYYYLSAGEETGPHGQKVMELDFEPTRMIFPRPDFGGENLQCIPLCIPIIL